MWWWPRICSSFEHLGKPTVPSWGSLVFPATPSKFRGGTFWAIIFVFGYYIGCLPPLGKIQPVILSVSIRFAARRKSWGLRSLKHRSILMRYGTYWNHKAILKIPVACHFPYGKLTYAMENNHIDDLSIKHGGFPYSCVSLRRFCCKGYPLNGKTSPSYHLQGEGRDALRASQGELGQALALEGAAEPIGAGFGALQRLGEHGFFGKCYCMLLVGVGGSPNGWVIMGNPIKMDELYRVTMVTLFHPISGSLHVFIM